MTFRGMVGYGFLAVPNLFLFFSLVGALLTPFFRRLGLSLLLCSSFRGYVTATPAFSSYLMHYLEEQCPTASVAELKSAEAIIVLGADIRPGRAGNADRLGPQSLERLVLATEAYRQLALPVLTSGGRMPSSELAVSELMKRVLEEYFAVPVASTENRSHTTYENALYVSEIMHRDGINTIVIVAQLRDIPRITWSFEKFGLRVFAWPAPSTPVELNRIEDYLPSAEAFNNSFYAFHELIGQPYYRFRYGRTKLYG